ncbi:hypothetical protein NHX12_001077 [Muraenolepis orangiensis]|uniref:ZP-C domain-containing protein n=1 Tax=Muraenolepis orangiensis TaxID=630683 RepID=A0A9Q0E020_9TELE|nr:hypothetical protein NHX12_001077 [Muraenolepis orangiensis]
MQVQSVPLGSVTIGSQAWRECAERSVRRAERLVRQTLAGQSGINTTRPRTCSNTVALRPKHTENKAMKPTETPSEDHDPVHRADSHGVTNGNMSRPQTTGTTFPRDSKNTGLRERCARQSTAVAGEYTRWVREVELRLRKQAARASRERVKLQRECAHLEMMLRSLRNDLQVNRESAEQRTERRPQQQDGGDWLLAWERRELAELKRDVEETLRETQHQLQVLDGSSREVQVWSNRQALVLDLLPHRGSLAAPRPPSTSANNTRTPPAFGFTSESEQALDDSSLAVEQSQRLRERIRCVLTQVVARQRASQRVVNGGLVKKVAETVTLERSLALTAATTRHAAARKQREVDSIRLSYGRAQGPESSGDVFTRERLGRPVVQVFQRHPGTQLPEATHLLQGSAVLRYCLSASEDDAARLQRCFLQLRGEARGKEAAARRDAAVVRMRLQRGDKRAIPHILQQGEPTCSYLCVIYLSTPLWVLLKNLPGSYLHLPGVLHFRNPLVPAEYFSPTRGTGSEPLPSLIRDLLLSVAPTPDSTTESAPERRGVVARCEGDTIRVQVQKSVLGSGGSASQLSLGTCRPTGSAGDLIYFDIGVDQCQTVRTPMFFEVEARSLAPDRRLYVQNCSATLGPSPSSTPRLTIVDNFGCMVKQVGRARFFPSRNNRVRFAMDAFLFEATGQVRTPLARWKATSGLESVCSCCETSCSSTSSSDTTVVSSSSWTVERRGKPFTPPRSPIDMTTTVTLTTVRIRTKSTTSQKETAVSPVEVDSAGWEWPVDVLKGSDVDSEVLKGSGVVKEVPNGSGVNGDVLKGSGVVKEVLKSSGRITEVLKGRETVRGVLYGVDGENLKGSGVVKEVLKVPGTVREVLKGSEGGEGHLNIFSGVDGILKGSGVDGKVTKGSDRVDEVLEGSSVVGKHGTGLAVEPPRRIFENIFGLDK